MTGFGRVQTECRAHVLHAATKHLDQLQQITIGCIVGDSKFAATPTTGDVVIFQYMSDNLLLPLVQS